MIDTVSPIEVVWIGMTAICLFISAGNLREVMADLEFWESRQGPRDEAVGFDIRSDRTVEILLILVQIMFGIIGVLAALLPARPDSYTSDIALLYAIGAPSLIILADLCLLLVSVVRARSRWVQKQHGMRRDRRADDQAEDRAPRTIVD
jgi:hypothetical protein